MFSLKREESDVFLVKMELSRLVWTGICSGRSCVDVFLMGWVVWTFILVDLKLDYFLDFNWKSKEKQISTPSGKYGWGLESFGCAFTVGWRWGVCVF